MCAINNTRYGLSVAVTPNSLLHAVSPRHRLSYRCV